MNNRTLITTAILVALVTVVPSMAQEGEQATCQVTYITGSSVYIDAGSEEGAMSEPTVRAALSLLRDLGADDEFIDGIDLKKILTEIQDGTYARKWIEENRDGRPWFEQKRRGEQELLIEQVGARLREMMPFLDPVTIKPGD